MKTILVGINSKYIHPNLAIRYLKSNSDFLVDIKEFTIKDDINNIYNNIIKENPDILGFSVYIWNIEIVMLLLKKFKSRKNMKIILGGPEVSYEYDELLKQHLTDFIIFNEGEIAFNMLLNSIKAKKDYDSIPNLAYLEDGIIKKNKSQEILYLSSLKGPYQLKDEDYINKIQYIELSRGCPFNCSYCLASLEEKVRYFDINEVYKNIKLLYSKGAKTFKFLDRTFNLKPDLALELFKFIIENNFESAIFQFEISGDILNKEIIDYLIENCPENLIRFEIGIQSVHEKVNLAVNRVQRTEKLFNNIRLLKKSNIILHLDLIAGLPYEDILMFEETFNKTFRLIAKELQLGILKMLKGTKIYYQKDLFGYAFSNKAPYEILYNDYLSENDMNDIKLVEESLDLFWNKGFMNKSIEKIIDNEPSAFSFFLNLGKYYLAKNKTFHRYQLEDIFIALEEFVQNKEFIYDIRYDYLEKHNIKPKIYWDNLVNKNEIIRSFFKENAEYNIDRLYKYSTVIKYHDKYLIASYFPNKKIFNIVKI